MHRVRMSVQENRLVTLVLSESDYASYIEERGRGWVVEEDGSIVAFAVGDDTNGSVWALFVDPASEGKGFGRQLHEVMVGWLWEQGHTDLWLTTERGTRAERFYRAAGWQEAGTVPSGEVRLTLGRPDRTQGANHDWTGPTPGQRR